MSIRMSRREQQRLQKRVKQLEELLREERSYYAIDYPGIYLCQAEMSPAETATIQIARKLSHAVCVQIHNGKVNFYAVPLEKIP